MSRKIYLASSWRNPYQQSFVQTLHDWGHEVYDFRNPSTAFQWSEVDLTSLRPAGAAEFIAALSTDKAKCGFESDLSALHWADTCILLTPCGRSAHMEAGWMAGMGKEVFVHLSEGEFEPELMYLLFHGLVGDLSKLRIVLEKKPKARYPSKR